MGDQQQRGGGPFHRRPVDKRFVKHVTSLQHQPAGWLPMDLLEVECKLMEVKKFSADYYDIDSKFRRPNLQLITAYRVQNPFLYGFYMLRKEQMGMQLSADNNEEKHQLRERMLYYPTTYKNLEVIARNNFVADWERGRRLSPSQGVKFMANSELANNAIKGDINPRLMIAAKVLTGVAVDLDEVDPEEEYGTPRPYFNRDGLCIDTFIEKNKSVFRKFNASECYPELVLVYRDVSRGPDLRTSRLSDVINHCQLSYRAGTRFNPEEITFQGSKATAKAKLKKKNSKTSLDVPEAKVVDDQPTGTTWRNNQQMEDEEVLVSPEEHLSVSEIVGAKKPYDHMKKALREKNSDLAKPLLVKVDAIEIAPTKENSKRKTREAKPGQGEDRGEKSKF